MNGLLAIGDCNTLGTDKLKGSSYPELIGRILGCPVRNCGFTMSTSREGLCLLRDNLSKDFDWITIQFGLVDSYCTFRYSPYILYYPDNFIRKQLRSLVKKYKKTCKKLRLQEALGETNVVPVEEYRKNLIDMIKLCGSRTIILPETIPHHDVTRNPAIQKYNLVLKNLAAEAGTCFCVELYDDFSANMEKFYTDETHINETGYRHIAKKITELF